MRWIPWVILPWIAWADPGDFLEDDGEVIWYQATGGSAQLGWVTTGLEDIDGDGAKEVIAGAPTALGGGFTVVYSGASGEEIYRFSEGSGGHGTTVADAGDVDDDGLHDILAGAPDGSPGRVFVYSGADGSLIHQFESESGPDGLGSAVSGLGDVDDDGHDDVLVGARAFGGTGRVYVFSGADGSELFHVDGTAGENFGWGVAVVGDVDGDDLPDFAVGAPDAGASGLGEVSLHSGADGSLLGGPWGPGANGWDLGRFFVGGPGDLDGDDVPDVYGGDFSASSGSGLAIVWSGADGSEILRLAGTAGEGLGCGRGAGDVDGDGVPDLAIGSWADSAGGTNAGKVTVFSGADGSEIMRWTSTETGENFGFDAEGIGDVDGDGRIDILTSGATRSRVYVLRGPAPDDGPPEEEPTGCGCASSPGPGAAWAAVGLLALVVRRQSAVQPLCRRVDG